MIAGEVVHTRLRSIVAEGYGLHVPLGSQATIAASLAIRTIRGTRGGAYPTASKGAASG